MWAVGLLCFVVCCVSFLCDVCVIVVFVVVCVVQFGFCCGCGVCVAPVVFVSSRLCVGFGVGLLLVFVCV